MFQLEVKKYENATILVMPFGKIEKVKYIKLKQSFNFRIHQ